MLLPERKKGKKLCIKLEIIKHFPALQNMVIGGLSRGKLSPFSDISQNSISENRTLHKIQCEKNRILNKIQQEKKRILHKFNIRKKRTFHKIQFNIIY